MFLRLVDCPGVLHAKTDFFFFVRFCKDRKAVMSNYRIVASTSPSRIEAHAGLFRSLMKGIFDPYVL